MNVYWRPKKFRFIFGFHNVREYLRILVNIERLSKVWQFFCNKLFHIHLLHFAKFHSYAIPVNVIRL